MSNSSIPFSKLFQSSQLTLGVHHLLPMHIHYWKTWCLPCALHLHIQCFLIALQPRASLQTLHILMLLYFSTTTQSTFIQNVTSISNVNSNSATKHKAKTWTLPWVWQFIFWDKNDLPAGSITLNNTKVRYPSRLMVCWQVSNGCSGTWRVTPSTLIEIACHFPTIPLRLFANSYNSFPPNYFPGPVSLPPSYYTDNSTFGGSVRDVQVRDRGFDPQLHWICSNIVLLGKALCSHVHSLDPGASGYLVGQWRLVCLNSSVRRKRAAGAVCSTGSWDGLWTSRSYD